CGRYVSIRRLYWGNRRIVGQPEDSYLELHCTRGRDRFLADKQFDSGYPCWVFRYLADYSYSERRVYGRRNLKVRGNERFVGECKPAYLLGNPTPAHYWRERRYRNADDHYHNPTLDSTQRFCRALSRLWRRHA